MTGRRLALIVANDEYDDQGLRGLRSPAADAAALADVLRDPAIADFEVDVVYNAPAHEVTARLEDHFTDGKPDDLLLLHFSCHGLKNEAGELFFAARNTRPERLGSTAVAADFVQRCMRGSRARQMVLLLDCCYGGAFAQGVSVRASGSANVLAAFPALPLGGGRGRAVISASSSMQYSFEGADLADNHQQPSVFTAALVHGLRTGEADRDEDGRVSLNELYDYVFDKVREENPHQSPTRDFELQGELYLARSNRKRVVAAALPRELAAALQEESMFARLGAVGELRSRLNSSDLPTALGAHAALADVARNDIRYVAQAASAAIEEAAVAAASTTLDFGQVEASRQSATLSLGLLGPPIARSSKAEPSDPWILVAPTADGFDVSVISDRIGLQRGSIAVAGPTGSVVVEVTAEVQPAHLADAEVKAVEPQIPPTVQPTGEGTVDTPVEEETTVNTPADASVSLTGIEVQPDLEPQHEAKPGPRAEHGVQPDLEPQHDAKPGPQPAHGRSQLEWREPEFTPLTKVAALAAAVAGLLLLIALGQHFLFISSTTSLSRYFFTWRLAVYLVLGGAAIAAAVGLRFGGLRAIAQGLLLSIGAAALWVVSGVGFLVFSDDYGLPGVTMALIGAVVLVLTGILVGIDLSRSGFLLLRRRPRGLRTLLVMGVSSVGLVSMVSLAVIMATRGASIKFLVEALWVAVLAFALPLFAVSLRHVPMSRGILLGWVLGGVGICGYYAGVLSSWGAGTVTAIVFGVSLLVVAILTAVFRGRFIPTEMTLDTSASPGSS